MLQRLGASTSPISTTPERCVNTRHRDLDCRRCQHSCPTDAVISTHPLVTDQSKCVRCGLCDALCPVGAISTSGANDLEILEQISRLLAESIDLEIACRRVVESGQLSRRCRQVLQLPCLARLPSVVIVGAMTRTTGAIWLNDRLCADCPLSKAHQGIRTSANEARVVALELGIRDNLICLAESPTISCGERPGLFGRVRETVRVAKSGERSLSRRELFTVFSRTPSRSDCVGGSGSSQIELGSQLPRRRRILASLIGSLAGSSDKRLPLPAVVGQPFLKSSCSGCGVCAKACPTSALRFSTRGGEGVLESEALRCVACGACTKVCSAKALEIDGAPTVGALKAGATSVLWRGQLARCSRCGSLYHPAENTSTTCPLCSLLRREVAAKSKQPLT